MWLARCKGNVVGNPQDKITCIDCIASWHCTHNDAKGVGIFSTPAKKFDNEKHLDSTLHWNKVIHPGATVNAFGIKAHHTICLFACQCGEVDKLWVALVKWEELNRILWIHSAEE